jgi:drug/metabolite transporter (DMT)-like permease
MKWLFILLTVCAGSCGDVLCAAGMSEGTVVDDLEPRRLVRVLRYIVTRRKVILGGCAYAVAFFALLGLLSTSALSVAIPATALSFVLDTVAARFLLHEHVPWKRWVGVLCVCSGVALVVGTSPLAGTAGSTRPAVQAHQNQPRHDEARTRQLDEQRAPAEVLAKP